MAAATAVEGRSKSLSAISAMASISSRLAARIASDMAAGSLLRKTH
jgi:hypothetical protein